MAGHSKFKNIMHRKGAQDAKRSRAFSKHARLIMNAARTGGADPSTNLSLRYAIDRARDDNMTNDAIDRAVAKGAGTLEGVSLEEITYEGYGAGGVAILIESLTDNRNRTFSEVRNAVEKRGGNLGEAGSVAWNFERKAVFFVPAGADQEETLLDVVLTADGDELTADEGGFEITAEPHLFGQVGDAVRAAGFSCEKSEITSLPKTTVKLEDPEKVAQLVRLLDALEELDDVQATATNLEWTEAALAAAEGA